MTPREAVGLTLAAVVVIGLWTTNAKRQGALQEKLAQNKAHIAVLDSALKVERAKFSVDTVKVFRRIARVDTLLSEVVRSDTLKLTDTVRVTVEVVREAVATLNACRETVLTCGQLRAKEQARGDSLLTRVKLLEKARPSTLGTFGRNLLWLGAGVALGRLSP